MSKEKKPSGNIVIAGFVRSPFTPAKKGELKDVRSDDLIAQVIKGLVAKTGVDPKLIEDLKLGCSFPEGEQGLNMARNVALMADLPKDVAGVTINRFCGSSMQAIHDAAGMIKMGGAKAVIAAGAESMSRIPMGGFNPSPNPDLYENYPEAYMNMGLTAEVVAKKYDVSRDKQQDLAIESHRKSSKAQKEQLFRDEIIEITTKSGKIVKNDGCVRPGTDKASLDKLKPAFDKAGTVTAGTSSPLTDGAVAVLVTTEEFAKEHGLEIFANIKSIAVSGLAPEEMGMGPVSASEKALKNAGLSIEDIDIVEINEAFGSQSVACIEKLGIDMDKVNLDGGALSMGHPLGASGARITGKASSLLKREGKRFALATMCIGGGQGIATILENPNYKDGKQVKLKEDLDRSAKKEADIPTSIKQGNEIPAKKSIMDKIKHKIGR